MTVVKRQNDENNPSPSKPSQGPKDLITLMNARNGETYKFACKTCIDGHRAPLCDPKKHRGKIMFRRPAPGRPARQCGHPKSAQCDCLAKRTLCCILSHDEWDLVEQGQIVQVAMYDSKEDLEEFQQAKAVHSQSTPPSFPEPASTPMTNGSFSSASTPAPQIPRSQMFGVGGPQGDSEAVPDPFPWTGELPHVQMHGMAPSYQLAQSHTYMLHSNPSYQQFHANYQGQPLSNQQVDVHRGSIPQHTPLPSPWPQPRPEYMPFNQPHYISSQDSHLESLSLDQMHLSPELQVGTPAQPFTPPDQHDQFAMSRQHSVYQPLPLSAIQDFAMDGELPMMQMDFESAPPPIPNQEVTQSCCSSKRTKPQQIQSLQPWQFPQSAPTQQFPCPRCASTMCTCLNCPEVMQNPLLGGAWARGCGRSGHLDAEEFITPILPPQQQQQIAAPKPSAPKSCCSGGIRTPTTQDSPYPQSTQGTPLWQGMHQQIIPQQPVPQHQGIIYDNNGMMIDPSMLYHPSEWQNMH